MEHKGGGLSAELTLRVRYAETDQMGVAHHANYFVWFEAARAELCRRHGIDYSRMEADGYFLPVVNAEARFLRPARYDEEIAISVQIEQHTRRSLRMAYTVSRSKDTLATGTTLQYVVDGAGKPVSLPEAWRGVFEARSETS